MSFYHQNNQNTCNQFDNAVAQLQQIQQMPEPDPTIRSLLEIAHCSVAALEEEIARLGSILEPVRVSTPEGAANQTNSSPCEPVVLTQIRAIIDRISNQTLVVREISNQTRI
jgi:hypothetical protein